uniref:Uncharacterized protein n=1 Tax=viral metagenome TaxID=1070528 RepID=A0A2V0RIU9_9ZZZZ
MAPASKFTILPAAPTQVFALLIQSYAGGVLVVTTAVSVAVLTSKSSTASSNDNTLKLIFRPGRVNPPGGSNSEISNLMEGEKLNSSGTVNGHALSELHQCLGLEMSVATGAPPSTVLFHVLGKSKVA